MTTREPRRPNRRRTVRVSVLGAVFGEPAGIARPLVVRDLSPGGFSVESPVPFLTRTRHRFKIVTGETRVEIDGVVIQSLRITPGRGTDRYLVGFSFVLDSAERRAQIYELLDAVFTPSR